MTFLAAFPAGVFAAALLFSGSGGMPVRPVNLTTMVSPTGPATRMDSTPLYTEEQATAGAAVFGRVCVECHEKQNVTSADFRTKWGGRPIFDLYELIRSTMPDSNPGALSRDEYAGTLAYILKLNGLPAGTTQVMPDSVAMRAAILEFPPPAH
jgi:mono/diheme cytochrome c family protein